MYKWEYNVELDDLVDSLYKENDYIISLDKIDYLQGKLDDLLNWISKYEDELYKEYEMNKYFDLAKKLESDIYKIHLKYAKLNNSYAQFNLALFMWNAKVIKYNTKDIEYWLELSSQNGYIPAYKELAILTYIIYGYKKINDIMSYFYKSLEYNDETRLIVAYDYFHGITVEKSKSKAFEIISPLLYCNNPHAFVFMGKYYYYYIGNDVSTWKKAMYYFEKAAKMNDYDGFFYVADLWKSGMCYVPHAQSIYNNYIAASSIEKESNITSGAFHRSAFYALYSCFAIEKRFESDEINEHEFLESALELNSIEAKLYLVKKYFADGNTPKAVKKLRELIPYDYREILELVNDKLDTIVNYYRNLESNAYRLLLIELLKLSLKNNIDAIKILVNLKFDYNVDYDNLFLYAIVIPTIKLSKKGYKEAVEILSKLKEKISNIEYYNDERPVEKYKSYYNNEFSCCYRLENIISGYVSNRKYIEKDETVATIVYNEEFNGIGPDKYYDDLFKDVEDDLDLNFDISDL